MDSSSKTHNNEIIHEGPSSISLSLIKPFIVEVEAILDKQLIGVDFIVDAEDDQKVYCIDINLFPAYTGFADVSAVMAQYILNKCH